MKLINKLKTLEQDEIVSIGSRSAFFFIGYPNEFIENEDKFNTYWNNLFKRGMESAITAYENCIAAPPDPNKEVTRREIDPKTRHMADMVIPYDVLYKEWQNKCDVLKTSKETAIKKFDKFKPFNMRDVKESYKSIDGKANVVIIRGYEVAPYWFKHEYDADKVKREEGLK